MKKAAKILIYVFVGILILVGSAVSYVKIALPNVGPAPELKVEMTPKRIERGKYLTNHVTVCIDCHSPRDWTTFAGPFKQDSIGTGGEKFDQTVGFPGSVYVPNITPFNLKNWTDGEIFRTITTGVRKDGSALFPIMPYQAYAKMDKEDIYSIIAYIRTLPEKESHFPARKLDFPLNIIVNTIPQKADLKPIPSPTDTLAYGAYLVNAAACIHCHTQEEKGKMIEGMEFAGGRSFDFGYAKVTSANITPDKETGLGNWTKKQFVQRFKMYDAADYKPQSVTKKDFNTIMPWLMYSGMKTSDLEAVYTYLHSLKPIKNEVGQKFVPAVAVNVKN